MNLKHIYIEIYQKNFKNFSITQFNVNLFILSHNNFQARSKPVIELLLFNKSVKFGNSTTYLMSLMN